MSSPRDPLISEISDFGLHYNGLLHFFAKFDPAPATPRTPKLQSDSPASPDPATENPPQPTTAFSPAR